MVKFAISELPVFTEKCDGIFGNNWVNSSIDAIQLNIPSRIPQVGSGEGRVYADPTTTLWR